MGHNIDLQWFLGLPEKVKCPKCEKMIRSYFDDYDIDCGEPNAIDGEMELDCYCNGCDEEFVFVVSIFFSNEYDVCEDTVL